MRWSRRRASPRASDGPTPATRRPEPSKPLGTAEISLPTRFLQGRDDRFFPVGFQRRVAGERLGITPDEMAGGHLVALSHPKELADRLEAYREDIAGRVGFLLHQRRDG